MTIEQKIDWARTIDVTKLDRVDLIDVVLTLRSALEEAYRGPASLEQALNSGRGIYRP